MNISSRADTAYQALVARKGPQGVAAAIETLAPDTLPAGEVTLRVAYSSLNYKDALSLGGHPGVTRKFPHVPGIDAAGTVVASDAAAFAPGAEVIVTGFEFGSGRWGGYAELTRVPADWVVPLPAGLSPREAMLLGTAGFTAAQSALAIERAGMTPASGDVLVTGASGGVGSVAVALLARLGYRVVAATGKPAAHPLLSKLGAAEFLDREALRDTSGKPLLPSRWAGAIDTVGGEPLATILRSTKIGGCVTACGLTAGVDLPLTVYPFILRGAQLVGIDSVSVPAPERAKIWDRLAGDWKLDLSELAEEIGLADVPAKAQTLLEGGGWGRTIVRVSG